MAVRIGDEMRQQALRVARQLFAAANAEIEFALRPGLGDPGRSGCIGDRLHVNGIADGHYLDDDHNHDDRDEHFLDVRLLC